MEQNSWEADRSSAIQKIHRILCNPKVYNSPPPIPTLSQVNPVYTPSHFLRILFSIILPSTPRSSMWS
jgi:hypothetical protein